MADTAIDKVKIDIEASATKAGDSINKLIEYVTSLREATGSIETKKLYELSGAITSLAEGMKNMPKLTAFTSLAKGIERLNSLDTSKLGTIAEDISSLANVNAEKLMELCISMTDFTESMRNVPSAKSFERLADGLARLNGTDTSNVWKISNSISSLADSVSSLNDSGIGDIRINVRADGATAEDMTPQTDSTAAGMEHLVDVSEEVQNAMNGMTDSMEETASSENQAGQSSSALADQLGALKDKWRDIEDSFSARDIISGAIYKMNSAVINGFSDMVSGAKTALDNLKSTVSSAAQSVAASIQQIPSTLQQIPSTLSNAIGGLKSGVSNIGASIKDAFTHPISTAIGGMQSLVQAAGSVRSALGNINLDGIRGSLSSLAQTAGTAAKSALSSCANAMKKVGSAAKTVVSWAKKAAKGIASLATKLRSAIGFFGKFSSGAKGSGNALSKLSSKLAKVTRLFTFMLLRKGITAMFSSLGTAFQHLAQKSESFNKQLSSLMSACSYFSHQIAAMTAPLLDLFGPALEKVINLLVKATSYINQFLSALTGKSVFTSAKKVATDYASSLDSVASAAKEIKDATVGIDELNIISQNDDSSSGSSSSDLEDCYEQLEIAEDIKALAENIKDILQSDDWSEIGSMIAEKVNSAMENIPWDNIQIGAEHIASGIGTLINGFVGEFDWSQLGTNIGNGINTALIFANTLLTTTNFELIGNKIATLLNSAIAITNFSLAGQTLANGVNMIIDAAYGFVTTFKFDRFGTNIGIGITSAINTVKWGEAGTSVGLAVTGLFTALKSAIDATDFKSLGNGIVTAISNFFANIKWSSIGGTISSAVKGLLDFLTGAIEGVNWSELPRYIVNSIGDFFKGFNWSGVASSIGSLLGAAVKAQIEWNVNLWNLLKEAWGDVSDYFKGYIDEAGGNIILGLWNGITDALSNVGSWIVENIFTPFIDGFKSAFGIHSPSTEMETMGGYIVSGFINGISGKFSDCMAKMQEWATNIKNWFTGGDGNGNIFEKFAGFASNIVSGFKNKIGSTYTTVKANVTTWASSVKNWFTGGDGEGNIVTKFKGYAENIISGFKNKVGNTYSTVKTNVTTWASNVKNWFSGQGFGGINSDTFTTYAGNIVDGFKNKVGSYYTTAKDKVTTWASNVKTWFTDNGGANSQNFSTFATNIIDGFKNKAGAYYTTAKSNIQTWGSNCVSWFNEKSGSGDWATVATNVVDGFKNKVGAIYSTCKTTIQNWGSSIISWFKEKLDINSPSRVFKELGGYTVEGFNKGIDSEADSTASHVSDWIGTFSDIQANISTRFNVDMSGLQDYTPNLSGDFLDEVAIRQKVEQQIESAGNYTASVDSTTDFKDALADIVEPYLNKLVDKATETANGIKESRNISVEIDGREIVKATDEEKSKRGYTFTPVTA